MPRIDSASDLARALARNALPACRFYLPLGRREGNYWLAGDVAGAPGRSLYVRLKGPDCGKGAAGKWTDAASGEHGDLLDLIALNRGLAEFRDVLDEARAFLGQPRVELSPLSSMPNAAAPRGSTEAARRLFAASLPIAGTIAMRYLDARAIPVLHDARALRFHPRCYYRDGADDPASSFPALIAAVTDIDGAFTAVHRTWLDPSGLDKAAVETPRRALGPLLGHGVRFGQVTAALPVVVAGEGLETTLSLRMALPAVPMIAAGSANHLAAILFPPQLRRLYIAVDGDPEGARACQRLTQRAYVAGIEALPLHARLGDFNDDLRCFGLSALRENLCKQLAPEDASAFVS
jgi:Toprim domain